MEMMTAFFKEHSIASKIMIVLFVLTLMLLGMVDLFTFRMNPSGHLSGNGNPALLFIFIFVPLYLIMLGIIAILSGTLFRDQFRQGSYHAGMFLFLMAMIAIGIFLERLYASLIFGSLRGWPNSPYSMIQGWGVLNQYTNTAFFNIITYILGWVGSIMLGYLWAAITHHRR
ncbi:hypothetical protein [Paenibacillus guangzhouensis]|uniref:hypothetical protein n=1 Tax=Paenibacillus guangzhouensis TaxID=1473112 RepID=UPI001266D024|nr:hypothetical protein [Paenibacillus guangzhouensis]